MQVALTHESLNSGDCFVLDAGMEVYVWQGKQSGIFEKNKAAELARAIDDERGAKPALKVVSEGDNAELHTFWKILGAGPNGPPRIKTAEEGGADDADSLPNARGGGGGGGGGGTRDFPKKLFRIHDSGGHLTFRKEAEGRITRNMFDSSDTFVFDLGGQIFVWVGKTTSALEKKCGLQMAVDYLKKENRPPHTPIARIIEGGENYQFQSFLD